MLERFWLKYATYILAVLLLCDIVFSFFQFYSTVLDGDMAGVILPTPGYQPVLHDPLGIDVLLHHKVYASPNRFSSHWCMYHYFRTVPFWLQSVTTPVNSIYLSCAILKLFTQLLIITMLALYITVDRFTWRNFLLAAVLITPLFQTFGYYHTMGIIDTAPTYVFFYALPLGLLLLLFYPFYKSLYSEQPLRLSIVSGIWLALWALFLVFNGSINSGVMLLISLLTLLLLGYYYYQKENGSVIRRTINGLKNIPRAITIYFLLFILLACYSFYIGLYNAESGSALVSLSKRYALMPHGLWTLLTLNKGLALLLFFIILNTVVIYFSMLPNRKHLLKILSWIVLFCLLYVLLLPLGGYRPYRPFIIRYDTFIPVTLMLIFFFGLSTYFILEELKFKWKNVYIAVLVLGLTTFSLAERRWHSQNNHEREAIQVLIDSKDSIVRIKNEGRLLTWDPVDNYHDSEDGARLLQFWGVIKEKKYYYQK